MSAPFAGHAAGNQRSYGSLPMRRQVAVGGSGGYGPGHNPSTNPSFLPFPPRIQASGYGLRQQNRADYSPRDRFRMRRSPSSGQFSQVTLDNILSNDSEIPSARREQRRSSSSSYDRYGGSEGMQPPARHSKRRINALPSRTSKTSQKLVLIPEELNTSSGYLPLSPKRSGGSSNSSNRTPTKKRPVPPGTYDSKILTTTPIPKREYAADIYRRSYKERQNLPRLTAYNIADGFDLKVMAKFLRETHEVSPRTYIDCLYVPYILPLLPGKEGFRIKSNVSTKIVGGKTLIDKMIDTSERRDHHYEYYSGVETIEDANNNYELEADAVDVGTNNNELIPDHLPPPMNNNPEHFDPSEPQFFAETNQKFRNDIYLGDSTGVRSSNVTDTFDSKRDTPNAKRGVGDDISVEGGVNGSEGKVRDTSNNTNACTDTKNDRDRGNNKTEGPHVEQGSEKMEKLEKKKLNKSPRRVFRSSENAGSNLSLLSQAEKRHAEIFIFHYGVIVFWNFSETQEKNILGDITFAEEKGLLIRPLDEQDIETEEFHFEYDKDTERPRIFNDVLTLRSGDHIIKLTLSYAIAQSSKLSRFEARISPILTSVSKLLKRLALYGTLGNKREQLLKKSGKLFKLRVDVNLSSSVLDTPDFFWSIEPSLHPLYMAMREYLEIDKRVQVVNDRCKVFLEFFDICVDSVAERNIARVTSWFLIAVLLSLVFSLAEIIVRYNIIHGYTKSW